MTNRKSTSRGARSKGHSARQIPVFRKAYAATETMLGHVIPSPGYYGWRVVFVCMLCACLSAPGQSYALALYIEPVSDDLGVVSLDVATLYAWATLAAALILPLAGRIADRTSSWQYLSAVVLLLGAALFCFSFVSALPTLGVVFFALRFLGQGATGLGVLTTVLRWFTKNRGRATALAMIGYALGEFVMPTIIIQLQRGLGWRDSLLVLAAVYVLVLSPLIAFSIRSLGPGPAESELHDQTLFPVRSTSVSRAVKMPRFWVLVSVTSVTPFVLTALLFNQVVLFDGIGWEAKDVARALQAYAVAGVACTFATGALLDRAPAKFGVLFSMISLCCALVVPLALRSGMGGIMLYGVLLGGAAGTSNATNGVLWPEHFGIESVGAIKGIVSTVRNGVTALAAPLGAWMLTRDGGKDAVLIAGAGLAAVSACVALLLPSGGAPLQAQKAAPRLRSA